MIIKNCKNCDKIFKIWPSKIKDNRGKYCSRECLYKWMSIYLRGKNHPLWRGEKYKRKNSYITISSSKYSRSKKRNCIYEHRLIMQKYLGRYLKLTEVVHHWNGVKTDNRIENLGYFRHNIAHLRLHSFAKRHNIFIEELKFNLII